MPRGFFAKLKEKYNFNVKIYNSVQSKVIPFEHEPIITPKIGGIYEAQMFSIFDDELSLGINKTLPIHINYVDRENFNLDTDQELKNLGTMEGSVHNVLATRIKGHGLSWSMTGANAMAKLLCLKHSQCDLLSEIEEITKRKINVDFEYNIKNELDNELKKAKKDINDAVIDILYEKTSKFSNKESHIKVFLEHYVVYYKIFKISLNNLRIFCDKIQIPCIGIKIKSFAPHFFYSNWALIGAFK